MFDILGIAKCNEQSKVQNSKSNLHLCNILYFEIGQSISAIADWHNNFKDFKEALMPYLLFVVNLTLFRQNLWEQ